jgi:hypothetical protein
MSLRCLFGLHRWVWFTLCDITPTRPSAKISQCDDCRRIKGGWLGKDHA